MKSSHVDKQWECIHVPCSSDLLGDLTLAKSFVPRKMCLGILTLIVINGESSRVDSWHPLMATKSTISYYVRHQNIFSHSRNCANEFWRHEEYYFQHFGVDSTSFSGRNKKSSYLFIHDSSRSAAWRRIWSVL